MVREKLWASNWSVVNQNLSQKPILAELTCKGRESNYYTVPMKIDSQRLAQAGNHFGTATTSTR